MKFTLQILSPLLILSTFGCGGRDMVTTSTPTLSPAKPADKQPDSCQILRAEYQPSRAEMTAPVATQKVVRHYQRVVRHSCTGEVVSDKVETVLSPRFKFDVDLPTASKFQSVFVFNETSCDHKLAAMPQRDPFLLGELVAITGDGEKRVTIKGDIAQAWLTFNMNPGMNSLYIRYYADCMPDRVPGNEHVIVRDPKAKVCEKDASSRTILYPINVEYSEKTLDGLEDKFPSPESCKQKQ